MKILFLTTVLPSARRTGGEIASQYFIDALTTKGHKVQVLGYQRQGDILIKQNHELPIAHRCIETNKSGFYPILWMGLGLFKSLSFSNAKYYSQKYIYQLQKILHQTDFDLIIFDHAQVGWLLEYIKPVSARQPKIIFIAHNIEHKIYHHQWQSATNYISQYVYQREANLIKTCEDKLASTADQVWTLTENDSQYFREFNPQTRVFNLPASIKKSPPQAIQKNYDVGIIGTWTWNANMQGLVWFLQTVYPLLPQNLSIHVAGKGAEKLCADYSNVKYCGFVADAQKFMVEAKVIAIPSISGGGVQIKTLDAIASGVPIVATPVALRGVSEFPRGVEIAEHPEEFARQLCHLVTSYSSSVIDIDHQLVQERQIWSKNRQETFEEDITQAVNLLNLDVLANLWEPLRGRRS